MIILKCPICGSDKVMLDRIDFDETEVFSCKECCNEFLIGEAEWEEK